MTSSFRRLIPTLNRILVRRVELETKTASGIILQEPNDKALYGEVVETGDGNFDSNGKLVPLAVKKGDTVLLPDYGGNKVTLKTGEYYLYRDSEVLGVLKKD